MSHINFRFSPCIFKVNHFYWPTNTLNCIKFKGKICVVSILKDNQKSLRHVSDRLRSIIREGWTCLNEITRKILRVFSVMHVQHSLMMDRKRSETCRSDFWLSFKIDTPQILTFEFYTIECISRPVKVMSHMFITIKNILILTRSGQLIMVYIIT